MIANGQSVCRRCDQTISGRNLPYARALEIIQNEEYLSEAELGVIRLKKKRSILRQKRQLVVPDYSNSTLTYEKDYVAAAALIAGLYAAMAFAVRDQGTIIGK